MIRLIDEMRKRRCRFADRLLKRNDEPGSLVPPRRIRRCVGPFEHDPRLYVSMREEYRECLRQNARLRPQDGVLDVGCGCGLMAGALVNYLEGGEYHGFDPDQRLIDWCVKNIARYYPHFHFRYVPVELYEDPSARYKSSEIVFSYEDEQFDVVIVKSIFTHMFPEAIERYMSQIRRVLKPGGCCFVTYYLLDGESLPLMQSDQSRWNFAFDRGTYRVLKDKDPLALVAHQESYIRDLYQRHGFFIHEPLHHGGWRRNTSRTIGQDFVVACKTRQALFRAA